MLLSSSAEIDRMPPWNLSGLAAAVLFDIHLYGILYV